MTRSYLNRMAFATAFSLAGVGSFAAFDQLGEQKIQDSRVELSDAENFQASLESPTAQYSQHLQNIVLDNCVEVVNSKKAYADYATGSIIIPMPQECTLGRPSTRTQEAAAPGLLPENQMVAPVTPHYLSQRATEMFNKEKMDSAPQAVTQAKQHIFEGQAAKAGGYVTLSLGILGAFNSLFSGYSLGTGRRRNHPQANSGRGQQYTMV